MANLPEEGGDVAGKASVRGPGKEARAAQGGAGEGAERGRRVGEGGRRAVQGKRGAAWGGRGGEGEARGGGGGAGRCRGSALPHAAQAAGDGGSRTVPVRPEKEAVGDTYPLLRAVP